MKHTNIKNSRLYLSLQHRPLGVVCGSFAALGFLSVMMFTAADFVSPNTHAESTIAANVGESYVSVTSLGAVNFNAIPSIEGSLSAGKDIVTVKTNASMGYKLYLSMGKTDQGTPLENKLFNGGDTTGQSGYYSPASGSAAAPAVLSADTWGFAVPSSTPGAAIAGFDATYSAPIPADGSKWAALPSATAPVKIQETTQANTEGETIDVYYGAKTDSALVAGVYSNIIMYTATVDSAPVRSDTTIDPDEGAAGDSVVITTPLITTVPIDASEVSATLGGEDCAITAVSQSPNSTFAVTCTVPELEPGEYTATVSIAKFGQTYTSSNQFTYKQSTPTMQTFTCSSLSTGASTQLMDSRDSKMYWVTKLNDGNCWMTQNLDLGDATGAITLTPDDTDIASNFTLPAATDSWNYVYDAAESYDPGNNYIANGTASSTSDASGLAADATEWHYHQGNYYNWYAATAGSRADQLAKDTVAPHSICPKGWQLPNNAGTKTFLGLGMTKDNVSTSPYFFPRAGYFSGSVANVGSRGYYWSSTAYGSDYGDYSAYSLYFGSSRVRPQGFDLAYSGISVRCVAR